jgi:hypothetical protein
MAKRKGAKGKIRVIKQLPNSEQSYKGKVKTHNYINRQNQLFRYQDLVEIYSVSAETIISDPFSHSENV